MTAIRLTSAAILLSIFGIAAPAFAEEHAAVSVQVQGPSRQQVWMKHRAKTWTSEHRTWEQRGGYLGYRVPDDQFTLSFGTEHTFRINSLPYRLVNDQPSFQYNGYWMNLVDPWPETWQDGWYDNDDVYIRYDNGYYLYDSKHPDVRLSVQLSQ